MKIVLDGTAPGMPLKGSSTKYLSPKAERNPVHCRFLRSTQETFHGHHVCSYQDLWTVPPVRSPKDCKDSGSTRHQQRCKGVNGVNGVKGFHNVGAAL